MTQVAVDTLKSARNLRDAGIQSRQAEAIASVMHRAITDSYAPVATKADLSVFWSDLAAFRADLATQLAGLETRLTERISVVEKRVSEVDSRVSAVDHRVSGVDHRVSAVDSRISALGSRMHRTIWAPPLPLLALPRRS